MDFTAVPLAAGGWVGGPGGGVWEGDPASGKQQPPALLNPLTPPPTSGLGLGLFWERKAD